MSFGQTKCELIDSPPSITMLWPVQNDWPVVMKYAQVAISSVVAQRLSGVWPMISSQSSGFPVTQSFNGVRTPPGSMLLHVAPYAATLSATFFVYAITPPLLAQYSGNSAPVCPLAEPFSGFLEFFTCKNPIKQFVTASADPNENVATRGF